MTDAADVSLETEGQVATPPNSSPKREEKPSPDSAMSHSDYQAELEDLMARMCTKDVRFDQLLNKLLQLLDACVDNFVELSYSMSLTTKIPSSSLSSRFQLKMTELRRFCYCFQPRLPQVDAMILLNPRLGILSRLPLKSSSALPIWGSH